MSSGMLIVRTLAELAMIIVLLVGFLKENKLLKWQRGALRLLRKLHQKAHDARERELEEELLRAQYADEYETDRSSKTVDAKAEAQSDSKKRKNTRGKVA